MILSSKLLLLFHRQWTGKIRRFASFVLHPIIVDSSFDTRIVCPLVLLLGSTWCRLASYSIKCLSMKDTLCVAASHHLASELSLRLGF